MDRLEGRNPVHEALVRNRRPVRRIWLDQGAKPDERIQRILDIAGERGVAVQRVERRKLDKMADGRVHNGIIAEADPLPTWTTRALLEANFAEGVDPFLVLADGLQYEHNVGAVLRTSLGFGATGMVLPTRRGADPLSPVVQRVSMGAIEVVPIVRESLFVAISELSRAGVRIVGADMGGTPMTVARLSGPLALVLGEEGGGLSSKLREKCDEIVSIPLRGELESLNVSVAAAVLMAEKRRQDGWFPTP
ncbi:MAG: 23S rRNA (guanosine(2251)-2'-O)-methyltransferase RlmB [Alphaproteobacteria bacterium]|nr:23S rRNA (guanosine(2251)-2'-O)-methyltransferase RlmB [Alphaproteobacteria bacterium]